MLVLKRRKGQKIHIGNDVVIVVSAIEDVGGQSEVSIGISAPKHVTIDREEVREKRISRISGVMENAKD